LQHPDEPRGHSADLGIPDVTLGEVDQEAGSSAQPFSLRIIVFVWSGGFVHVLLR